MDHSSVTAVSKNVGESDKEPRKITRLTATKSHLIKLVYSLGEGAIKICYRKLQVVLRFSLTTFGKIKKKKEEKIKIWWEIKKNVISDYESVNSSYKLKSMLLIITYFHHFLFLLLNRRQKIRNERQVCFYFLTYPSLTISLITIGDIALHYTARAFIAHANMNSFVAYETLQDLRWCMWNSRKLPYDISGKLTKGCEQSETARAAALKS